MTKFKVTGMSCAACSARVEKAVKSAEGVTECSVNLLTGMLTVNSDADKESVTNAVINAGYGIQEEKTDNKATTSENKQQIEDVTTPKLKNRLITSLLFLIILMYFSMGYTMWNFPLPQYFENNPVAVCLVQMLLTEIIMVINKSFFISGFKALFRLSPNMDSLVAVGSSAAFIYSLYALFKMTDSLVTGNAEAAFHYMHEMYFESAAMILTLITVGKMLESRAKGKTTNALKSLMNLKPKTAIILEGNNEKTVSVDSIRVNDTFILKPGSSVPVDGEIVSGHGSFDESSLTGESIPVDKTIGDKVYSGTVNKTGYFECRATRVGEDTTLSQIISMVDDASGSKAPVAKIADKVSGVFVPIVIAIALITTVTWLILGHEAGYALARGISVLVISCPCALGLATPVAIMVGNGVAAKNGILFKTATALENTGKIKTVVLDKTGTVTKGKPRVTDIIPNENTTPQELISAAYSLESKSEHPLAHSITEYAISQSISPENIDDFEIYPGGGLKGVMNGKTVAGGNLKYIKQYCTVPDSVISKSTTLSDEGKTILYFCTGEKLLGIFAVADEIKEDSKTSISELKRMGIHTVLLTGDNSRSAESVARQVGIDEVISGVLPDGKEKEISRLMKHGKTAMVGDGINDAIALAKADVGIAIGNGTDIAIESADIVLMNPSIMGVAKAIKASRNTLRNIKQNLFWAFFYNAVGIPLAAGVFINTLGWELNPMFGAAAMSLSSFCVVTNALRLNMMKLDTNKTQHKIQEVKTMELTLKIEGMMCPHCEANVKKNLELIDGVKEAIPDHTKGLCKVVLEKEIDKTVLVNTVNGLGYKAE